MVIKELGQNGPLLIMVHGGPGWDYSYLKEAALQLSISFRVLLIDIRGCGAAARFDDVSQYTLRHVAEDLDGIVDAHKERPILLGFSFGAAVVTKYVECYPDKVRGVVLCSCQLLPYEVNEPLLLKQREMLANSPLGNLSKEMAFLTIELDIHDPSNLDKAREVLNRVSFDDAWIHSYRAGINFEYVTDPVGVLNRTGLPVLIVHGEYDRRFPLAGAEKLHRSLDSSKLVVIRDSGHLAHLEDCPSWCDAIKNYMSEGGSV